MSGGVSYLKAVVALIAVLIVAGLLGSLFVMVGVIPARTTTLISSSTLTAATTLTSPITVTSILTKTLTSVYTSTRMVEHSSTTTQIATITVTTTKPLLPVDYKSWIIFRINPTIRDDSHIWRVNETAIGIHLEVHVLEASWPSNDRRIKSLEFKGPNGFYINLTQGDLTMKPVGEWYTDLNGSLPSFYIETIFRATPSQVVIGGEYFVRMMIQREDGSVIHAYSGVDDRQQQPGWSPSYEEWHLITPKLLEMEPPEH